MKKFNFLPYVFIFLITFFVLQFFQNKDAKDTVATSSTVSLETVKDEYAIGSAIQVKIQNNTAEDLIIKNRCPLAPLDVYLYKDEAFVKVENELERDCSQSKDLTVKSGDKTVVSLLDYSYSLFGEAGRYKITLPQDEDNLIQDLSTQEFEIVEPGIIKNLWRTIIYNPILNILVALIIYIPGHYLGIAIILLTIIIRTILLIPSQKAMKAQRRMQDIQPKLEELKKRHAGDQTRLAQETMLLWKTHQVNPLSSCLPLLIQFPILIALFYAVNGGLSPDRQVLIYSFLPAFSLSEINASFLGFNLMAKSLIVFPIVIGLLQFGQMQLMMTKKSKSQEKTTKSMPQEMEAANKMMKYIMPVMIAVFTAQLPSAVGLYWGVSTFYGIVQQFVVNKESSKLDSPDEEVQVRVLNHKHGKTN
ncbi:MAG: YidC/Oxa1 family membrane protein insertase [Candidatus Gracilibacteria bacterium]